MRLDRFTTPAQEALNSAQSLAISMAHAELTPLHLLAVLVEDSSGLSCSILDKSGIILPTGFSAAKVWPDGINKTAH